MATLVGHEDPLGQERRRRGDCGMALAGKTTLNRLELTPVANPAAVIPDASRSGASEDRLAQALNLDAHSIRLKRDLLEGICPEAVELLKNRRVSAAALRHFKKVRPSRQIEMAGV